MRLTGVAICSLITAVPILYLGDILSWWVGDLRIVADNFVIRYFVVIVIPLMFLFGLKLRRKARIHLINVIDSPQEVQGTSYVLYLRPFEADAPLAKTPWQSNYPYPLNFLQLLSGGLSEEEQIAAALKRVGPLIAVGSPDEKQPRSGAQRMYVPPPNWKEPVRELISGARLVVLTLGDSDGVIWELVESMRVLAPERLILLVSACKEEYGLLRGRVARKLDEKAADILRESGETWIPPALPDHRYRGFDFSEIKGAICFSPRRISSFIDLSLTGRPIGTIGQCYDRVRWGLLIGLRPVINQLLSYEMGLAKGASSSPKSFVITSRHHRDTSIGPWRSRTRAVRFANQCRLGLHLRSKKVKVPDYASVTTWTFFIGLLATLKTFIQWWIWILGVILAFLFDFLRFGHTELPGLERGATFTAHFFCGRACDR
ncbi:MAG: hypothetical protein ACRDS9_08460 [Pseudonocardiaceae bacterium]